MRTNHLRWVLTVVLFCCAAVTAKAQNVAGVYPPGFGPDHASFQYRIGFDPDNDGVVQRAHYQESIDARRMWRIAAQTNKSLGNTFDVDRVFAELFWNLSKDGSPWQQGVRFDAIVRTEGRPGILAVNWSGQYVGIDNWRFRFNVLNGIQIGDDRQRGVIMQTRAQVHRTLSQGRSVGIEHFGSYGSTDNFRDFDEQGHQLGPYAILPVGGGWRLHGSVLFGLTDATPDTNFKLWINRSF